MIAFSIAQPRKALQAGVILALLVAGLCAAYYTSMQNDLAEVNELADVSWTYDEYETYFIDLAREKGGAYAFRVMKYVPLPEGIDTHMIGHQIAYVLYDQKGVAGLGECTQDFRNACSHGVITQEYVFNGTAALDNLIRACMDYPAGSIAYGDCFHGIGHGVLAHVEYDYKRAVEECGVVEEATHAQGVTTQDTEAWHQCIGGATMELMQGAHDQEAWERMKPLYTPASDVLMPCTADFLPDEMRSACYAYIRARLFSEAGRTRLNYQPTPEMDAKVLSYCELIPKEQKENRYACYFGIGADFAFFANRNDHRTFANMPRESMLTVHERCALAVDLDAQGACVLSAAEIIFNGGIDNGGSAVEYCSLASSEILKNRCYFDLATVAREYASGGALYALCGTLPTPYRHYCLTGEDDVKVE